MRLARLLRIASLAMSFCAAAGAVALGQTIGAQMPGRIDFTATMRAPLLSGDATLSVAGTAEFALPAANLIGVSGGFAAAVRATWQYTLPPRCRPRGSAQGNLAFALTGAAHGGFGSAPGPIALSGFPMAADPIFWLICRFRDDGREEDVPLLVTPEGLIASSSLQSLDFVDGATRTVDVPPALSSSATLSLACPRDRVAFPPTMRNTPSDGPWPTADGSPDNSKDQEAIVAMAGELVQRVPEAVHGLTRFRLDRGDVLKIRFEPLSTVPARFGGGVCFHMDAVELALPPIEIFIASEYAPGSCNHAAVLRHEMSHHEQFAEEYRTLQADLRDALLLNGLPNRARPVYADSPDQARDAGRTILDALLVPLGQHVRARDGVLLERTVAFDRIDTQPTLGLCPPESWRTPPSAGGPPGPPP